MKDTELHHQPDEFETNDEPELPRAQLMKGEVHLRTLSEQEKLELIDRARSMWRFKTGYSDLEWPFEKFGNQSRTREAFVAVRSIGGWLRYVRSLRRLSMSDAAKKAGLSKSAYQKFEDSERRGAISINNLERVARAVNMELVIGMRPIELPSRTLWESLEPKILSRFAMAATTQPGAARSLAGCALFLSKWGKFTRSLGWTERSLQLEFPRKN